MSLLVLERDGIVNLPGDTPAAFTAMAGALVALGQLSQAGHRLVIISDEPGLASGALDIEALNRAHGYMLEQAAAHGGHIEAIFFCPHAGDAGCDCRRPAPGLLAQAAERARVSTSAMTVLGTRAEHVAAARAVGAVPVLIGTATDADADADADVARHADLAAFAAHRAAGD